MVNPSQRAALAAVLAAVVGVIAGSSGAFGGSRSSPPLATHRVEPCGSTEARYTVVDLGRSFQGLALRDSASLCETAPPSVGPPAPVRYSSRSYGDCVAVSEAGCAPPLQIESWPECRRDLASYSASDEISRTVLRHHFITLPQRPELPVASFEGGTRLELYTGSTTVVISADSPALAYAAAIQAANHAGLSVSFPIASASAATVSSALRRLAARRIPPPGTAPVSAHAASASCVSPVTR